jgi:hypothetical protein
MSACAHSMVRFEITTRYRPAKASDSRAVGIGIGIAMASPAAFRFSRTDSLRSRASRLTKPRSMRDILQSRAPVSPSRLPRAIAAAHASSDCSASPIRGASAMRRGIVSVPVLNTGWRQLTACGSWPAIVVEFLHSPLHSLPILRVLWSERVRIFLTSIAVSRPCGIATHYQLESSESCLL